MKALLVGLIIVVAIGLACENLKLKSQIATSSRLPELSEIQERIGAEPDGEWGEETRRKWDAAICQQFSEIYINERSMK